MAIAKQITVTARPLFPLEKMWREVRNLARATVGKPPIKSPVSDEFKALTIRSEHSPIRALQFIVEMEIPYFASVHLVRHKHGVEHFVCTSREDRTGVPREERRQTDLVRHTMLVNAQALIFMSYRRLCTQADPTTREAWKRVKKAIGGIEPLLAKAMVPPCVYRNGYCPEREPCKPKIGRKRLTVLNSKKASKTETENAKTAKMKRKTSRKKPA